MWKLYGNVSAVPAVAGELPWEAGQITLGSALL